MADTNKIGLEAIFESADFQQGIAAYNAAISDSIGVTQGGSDAMQSSFQSLSGAIDQMASDTAGSLAEMSGSIDSAASEAASAIDGSTTQIETDSADLTDAAESDAEAFRASRDELIESMYGTSDASAETTGSMEGDLGDLDGKVKDTASKTKDSTSSMSDAFKELEGAGKVAFGALAAAIAGVTAELALATSSALESEKVMATSAFTVKKFGAWTGITQKQIDDLAASISSVVPIDDEVITQAISMGMTFDGVNKGNIEPLAKSAADLALFTGKDMVTSMKELALAVTDPDKALRLFKDAHVTLTDIEKQHLKQLKSNGSELEKSTYILGLVTDKVGGFGEALGQTAGGKIGLMQTAVGNMQEALGGGFLAAVGNGADAINKFASNPQTLANLTLLGNDLGFVANIVIEGAAGMASALANNQGIIIGALSAITVALLLAAAAAVAVFIATAEISVPLLAIAAAIAIAATLVGAVVALVSTAWIKDWGGIQEKTQAVWNFLEPIFRAIGKVIQFVVGAAIGSLMLQWNVLASTMQTVTRWTNANVMPLFNAIANVIQAVVNLQLRELGFAFGAVVTAGTVLSDWISRTLNPIFNALGSILDTYLMPIIKPMADFLSGTFAAAFAAISTAVSGLIDWLNKLATALNSLKIPDNLTPGSPTPFEIGLRGINDELANMANATLPSIRHQMEIVGTVRDVQNVSGRNGNSTVNTNNRNTNNYLFNPKFGPNGDPGDSFGFMEGFS